MYKVIGADQQVYGPVAAAQLHQWMAEGRIHLTTLVQFEGTADWKPLSSLTEFALPPTVNMPRSPTGAQSDGIAIAGLICGILSLVCCCAGTIFGILGLVFSIIVLSRRQDYPAENSRQMALIGLILSIVGLLSHFILPLFFIVPGALGIRHFKAPTCADRGVIQDDFDFFFRLNFGADRFTKNSGTAFGVFRFSRNNRSEVITKGAVV